MSWVAGDWAGFSFVDNRFLSDWVARLEHMFEDDPTLRPTQLGALVDQVRANAVLLAANQADQLRLLARLADVVSSEAVAGLAALPRVPGAPQDHEVIDSAVDAEVQAVLGIAAGPAARLVHLARRLSSVLPQVLVALADGRLDLTRARVLAEATEVLGQGLARQVADQLLEVAGPAPWAGLSPRAWRARVERTVVRADAEAARRRRVAAYAARAVRSLPTIEGMAELCITADAADVAMAEQVLTDLAQRPGGDRPGGDLCVDGPAPGRRVRRAVPPSEGRAVSTGGRGAPGT